MTDQPWTVSELRELFPEFDQHALLQFLLENGTILTVQPGQLILSAGDAIRKVPLVLQGSVKVSRQEPEGREIFLYYIRPGETCAMTLNACYKREKSRVNATTQELTTLLLIPDVAVYEAARMFPAWQRFSVDSFGRRYDELLNMLESVVFQPLERRLKHYLAEKSQTLHTRSLQISQQQIAEDLNSSREVISRMIKNLEQDGYLRHARGVIEII